MRGMMTMLAACALAACGTDADDAPAPGAPGAADSVSGPASTRATDAPADTASYAFRLHETQAGVVDSITVTRGGTAVQTLRPSENAVPPESPVERIHRADLDFDGHADLGFVTELSMAGSRSEYWRIDPRTGRFAPAGVYETLQPDYATRELTTYIRGGHAGRLWTASRWRWMDGALVEVRQEEQDVLPDDAGFVRIIRERRGGALVETGRDTLADTEMRGGPSWMVP